MTHKKNQINVSYEIFLGLELDQSEPTNSMQQIKSFAINKKHSKLAQCLTQISEREKIH
jgi:hypothetical protein